MPQIPAAGSVIAEAPSGAEIPRPSVARIILLEFLILVSAGALCSLYESAVAIAVLLAGVCYLIPRAWLAWSLFRYSGAKNAQRVARSLYRGEAGKFMLSCTLFALVFSFVSPLRVGVFFVSYAVMCVLGWVVSAVMQDRLAGGRNRRLGD